MNKTLNAIKVSFNQNAYPKLRNMHFISEPEAGALFAIKDFIANERGYLKAVSKSYETGFQF
jgi:hypothetical protein